MMVLKFSTAEAKFQNWEEIWCLDRRGQQQQSADSHLRDLQPSVTFEVKNEKKVV